MKLVSYQYQSTHRSGLMIDDQVYDLQSHADKLGMELPSTMLELLQMEESGMETAKKIASTILQGKTGTPLSSVQLLAPIPNPTSCRDAYAFRQHVATARSNRGADMIPEFDQFPIFYFTNHNAIYGPGEVIVEDDHLHKLDFELELAIVIGKRGKNIPSSEADQYIAGFTIMNDFSARKLQMEEMRLNLGPAKGKDFATTIGPWLVTPDELTHKTQQTEFGNKYNLKMEAFHNRKQVSEGNAIDMNWTFAEIIERCSYGTELYPGDIIGSGTVGTGCYLELNGTWALEAKASGENFEPIWLENRDEIELRIEGLGILRNRIIKSAESHSILDKKRHLNTMPNA